jgi:hypothetical protein
MEKRCIACGDDRRWANCRTVLQRALLCNRDAPALLQAWGLMEMQVWPAGHCAPETVDAWLTSVKLAQVLILCVPASPPLPTLQRGNFLAAVLLLDRSAVLEPRNRPVLKWKPVVQARQTVGARRGQHKSTPPAS